MTVWVRSLTLDDFRSYPHVECRFDPGVNVLLGRNGQGKTNVLEAIGYVATQRSHRAASDALLVRRETERALIACEMDSEGQTVSVDIAIIPGRANKARVNRVNVPRASGALGHLRTVIFAPEDLALVKGDPSARRDFLDDVLVQMHPRLHGVIAEFDRALRQRNSLLKSARERRMSPDSVETSLNVWDEHVSASGGHLVAARVALVEALDEPFREAYARIADTPEVLGGATRLAYRASWLGERGERGELGELGELGPALDDAPLVTADDVTNRLRQALVAARPIDRARGVTTIGPQRDELDIRLDGSPARGFASHGESWSLALAMRLAAYRLFVDLGPGPVLLLDDVFAELDTRRRAALLAAIEDADQVIVTAAVEEDVPGLAEARILDVASGAIASRARA